MKKGRADDIQTSSAPLESAWPTVPLVLAGAFAAVGPMTIERQTLDGSRRKYLVQIEDRDYLVQMILDLEAHLDDARADQQRPIENRDQIRAAIRDLVWSCYRSNTLHRINTPSDPVSHTIRLILDLVEKPL